MKLGANHPMGPLALGDLIGLDVCPGYHGGITERDRRSEVPSASAVKKDGSRLDILDSKTGKGFYDYSK